LLVIDSLDEMKKDSKLAREAIRWLENQFKHGNRFIRAQVQNEMTTNKNQMKNKDVDLYRLAQLIDCCKYFQENHNLVDIDENIANMVTLLVNNSLNDDHLTNNAKNLLFTCQKENINVKNIADFYAKWNSLHS
jgi:protein SMG5